MRCRKRRFDTPFDTAFGQSGHRSAPVQDRSAVAVLAWRPIYLASSASKAFAKSVGSAITL